jgi:hypothetical protein
MMRKGSEFIFSVPSAQKQLRVSVVNSLHFMIFYGSGLSGLGLMGINRRPYDLMPVCGPVLAGGDKPPPLLYKKD